MDVRDHLVVAAVVQRASVHLEDFVAHFQVGAVGRRACHEGRAAHVNSRRRVAVATWARMYRVFAPPTRKARDAPLPHVPPIPSIPSGSQTSDT